MSATPLILVVPADIMQRGNYEEISNHAQVLLGIELEIYGIKKKDGSPSGSSQKAESDKSGSGNESDDAYSFCASSKAPSSRKTSRSTSISSDISLVNDEQVLDVPTSTLDQLFTATMTLREQQLSLESLMKSLSIQQNETFESLKEGTGKNVAAIESLLDQFKALQVSDKNSKNLKGSNSPKQDDQEPERESVSPELHLKNRSRRSTETDDISPKKRKVTLFSQINKEERKKLKKQKILTEQVKEITGKILSSQINGKEAQNEYTKVRKNVEELRKAKSSQITETEKLLEEQKKSMEKEKNAMKEVQELLHCSDKAVVEKKLTEAFDRIHQAESEATQGKQLTDQAESEATQGKQQTGQPPVAITKQISLKNSTQSHPMLTNLEQAEKYSREQEERAFMKKPSYFEILQLPGVMGHSGNMMHRIYNFQRLLKEDKYEEAGKSVNLRDENDPFLEQIVRSIWIKAIWYNYSDSVNSECAQLTLSLQQSCTVDYAKKQMFRKYVTSIATELFEGRCIPHGLCTPSINRRNGFTTEDVQKYEQLLGILRFAAELYNVGMLELSLIKWFILRLQITAPNIEQFATLPCNESAIDLALSIVGVIQDRLIEEDTEYLFWVTEAINNISEYFAEQKFNREKNLLSHYDAKSLADAQGHAKQKPNFSFKGNKSNYTDYITNDIAQLIDEKEAQKKNNNVTTKAIDQLIDEKKTKEEEDELLASGMQEDSIWAPNKDEWK